MPKKIVFYSCTIKIIVIFAESKRQLLNTLKFEIMKIETKELIEKTLQENGFSKVRNHWEWEGETCVWESKNIRLRYNITVEAVSDDLFVTYLIIPDDEINRHVARISQPYDNRAETMLNSLQIELKAGTGFNLETK